MNKAMKRVHYKMPAYLFIGQDITILTEMPAFDDDEQQNTKIVPTRTFARNFEYYSIQHIDRGEGTVLLLFFGKLNNGYPDRIVATIPNLIAHGREICYRTGMSKGHPFSFIATYPLE